MATGGRWPQADEREDAPRGMRHVACARVGTHAFIGIAVSMTSMMVFVRGRKAWVLALSARSRWTSVLGRSHSSEA